MNTRRLLAACLILAAPAPAVCADGDGVRLEITGLDLPYARVVYEVRERDEAVTVRVAKHFSGRFGRQERVGLLPLSELPSLMAKVEAALRRRAPREAVARYRVTLSRRGAQTSGFLNGPGGREPPVAGHLRAVIEQASGPIPFRDLMLLPAEAGRLRLQADRPAAVAIDGVPLDEQTPLEPLLLSAGQHTVTLTPLDGGEPRVYPVKVPAGKTTSLSVELR